MINSFNISGFFVTLPITSLDKYEQQPTNVDMFSVQVNSVILLLINLKNFLHCPVIVNEVLRIV